MTTPHINVVDAANIVLFHANGNLSWEAWTNGYYSICEKEPKDDQEINDFGARSLNIVDYVFTERVNRRMVRELYDMETKDADNARRRAAMWCAHERIKELCKIEVPGQHCLLSVCVDGCCDTKTWIFIENSNVGEIITQLDLVSFASDTPLKKVKMSVKQIPGFFCMDALP
jgi:hypothetical protein